MGSRVQLYADIRHDARVDGLSIRELARKHGVHRRTVRQALAAAEPPPRKKPVRTAPRLDPYKPAIDEMLTYDLTAPRKQRHTATRILARLRDEHGATDLSYSTVRDYVRVRRTQIDLEAGRRVEAMVPQDHAPGAEAEVDFGEVYVILDGVKTKCHMFVYRLSHSGKAIHRVYPTGGQEAFHALGGIPTRHIRYDNLTSAVVQVIHGGDRLRDENERWVLFRSHYGFDAFYCASPASTAPTRKAASRARSDGSAATTSPPCPKSPPWTNSTTRSAPGSRTTTPAASPATPTRSGRTTTPSCPTWHRCRPTTSTPA